MINASSFRLGRFLEGAAIAAFALGSSFAVARVGLEPPPSSRAMGVVFAPWVDARDAFTRAISAGSRFLRFGGYDFVVVVEPEADNFAERVKQAGALLVVDPRVLTACLPSSSSAQEQK